MSRQSAIQLFQNIRSLITQSKRDLYSIANITLTETYFHIGRLIVEHEQQGQRRAAYAKKTITQLSEKLTKSVGKGFSTDNLENMRKFYLAYKDRYNEFHQSLRVPRALKGKSETVSRKLQTIQKSETVSRKLNISPFELSWSHYLFLITIEGIHERKFYEIESKSENWSVRELKRQYESALFERLVLSKNKRKVRELGKKGHVIKEPADAVKDPYIFEFLDLKEKDSYSESDLEKAIVGKLEHFLLELGKGFLFVDRQKRIRVDGDEYKIDLVFYNRILRCFVLIDLKIGTLQHKDIGQMQMYVNYYDEEVRTEVEGKTIGIILCRNKKESTIKYTLGKGNTQIFASRYKMYFPEKQILKLVSDL
ncbi:MAG: PDDEXK nuclease domain-containing protein [Bacteroidetes bacterium]|nr:PDDEXK nuclease domain-containing protein [Bacteroidota bacterium]